MEQSQFTPADQKIISTCFLFQHISAPLVKQILDDPRLLLKTYEKGEVIFDCTRFHRALGLVLSGKVESCPDAQHPTLILRHHHPGDVFGLAAMFGESPTYIARLEARTKTRVLFFPQTLLAEYMAAHFQLAENYITFLSSRVRFLTNRLTALSAGKAEAQLLNFLTTQADEHGIVTLDTPIATLARRLNLSRASLYRAFESLENKSILKKSGKSLKIINMRSLNE